MINHRENLIDILGKISDPEFQKEVWVDHKYWDRITDFGEAVNTLDDYFFFDLVEARKLGLKDSEYHLADDFVTALLGYEEPKLPAKMLSDESWLKITEQARIVLNALQKSEWGLE